MIPQIILLSIYFISLGMTIADHGKEKTGKENAWTTLLSLGVLLLLLWWGGFFDCFGL